MNARWRVAIRAGWRVTLTLWWLQASVAMALATALPEVGHRHAPGTPEHPHALVEVGGLGLPATLGLALPALQPQTPGPGVRRPLLAPRWRRARVRLGRDPPGRGVHRPRKSVRPPNASPLRARATL